MQQTFHLVCFLFYLFDSRLTSSKNVLLYFRLLSLVLLIPHSYLWWSSSSAFGCSRARYFYDCYDSRLTQSTYIVQPLRQLDLLDPAGASLLGCSYVDSLYASLIYGASQQIRFDSSGLHSMLFVFRFRAQMWLIQNSGDISRPSFQCLALISFGSFQLSLVICRWPRWPLSIIRLVCSLLREVCYLPLSLNY